MYISFRGFFLGGRGGRGADLLSLFFLSFFVCVLGVGLRFDGVLICLFLSADVCICQRWEPSSSCRNSSFSVVPGVILKIILNLGRKCLCVFVHYNRELLMPCAPVTIVSAILSRFSLS